MRRWEALESASADDARTDPKCGFATFEDLESLAIAVKLLHDETVEVPSIPQPTVSAPPEDETRDAVEKTKLQVAIDPSVSRYLESRRAERAEDEPEQSLQ